MDIREFGQMYLQPKDLMKAGGKHHGTIENERPPELGGQSVVCTIQNDLINSKHATWIDVEPDTSVSEVAPKPKPKPKTPAELA